MAGTILFLASRAGAYVNGAVWLVDGGRVGTVASSYWTRQLHEGELICARNSLSYARELVYIADAVLYTLGPLGDVSSTKCIIAAARCMHFEILNLSIGAIGSMLVKSCGPICDKYCLLSYWRLASLDKLQNTYCTYQRKSMLSVVNRYTYIYME